MVQGTALDDGGLAIRGEQGSWPRLLTATIPDGARHSVVGFSRRGAGLDPMGGRGFPTAAAKVTLPISHPPLSAHSCHDSRSSVVAPEEPRDAFAGGAIRSPERGERGRHPVLDDEAQAVSVR